MVWKDIAINSKCEQVCVHLLLACECRNLSLCLNGWRLLLYFQAGMVNGRSYGGTLGWELSPWLSAIELSQPAWQRWCMPLIPALERQRQADFWVRGQPGLQSELQDSQGYIEKPCLRKKNKNQKIKQKPKQTNKQNKNNNKKRIISAKVRKLCVSKISPE